MADFTGGVWVPIIFGPSNPSSVAGAGPAIADGASPDDLFVCDLTALAQERIGEGPVSTVNSNS